MTILLECVDRQQRPVVLTEDVWLHQALPRRPILVGLEHCIPFVLRDPFRVFQDAVHPNVSVSIASESFRTGRTSFSR